MNRHRTERRAVRRELHSEPETGHLFFNRDFERHILFQCARFYGFRHRLSALRFVP